MARDHHRRGRGARGPHVGRERQADFRSAPGRCGAGLRHPRLLGRQRAQAPGLPAGGARAAALRALEDRRLPVRPARCDCRHHAVELPGGDPHVGDRAGACRRQHHGFQTGIGHGAHRSRAGRPGAARGDAGRCSQRRRPPGLGHRCPGRSPRCRQGALHRFGRCRSPRGAALRRADRPVAARARRQRRGGGGGRCAVGAHREIAGLGGVHEHRAVVRFGGAGLCGRRDPRSSGAADREAHRGTQDRRPEPPRCRSRAADHEGTAGHRHRARRRCGGQGRQGAHRGRDAGGAGVLTTRRPSSPMSPTTW